MRSVNFVRPSYQTLLIKPPFRRLGRAVSAALPFCFLSSDECQNLLGKGNDNASGKGQEPVGTLGRVVGLEGKADLNDAPAHENESDGPDQSKNKIGQVVDHADRVVGGKGRNRRGKEQRPMITATQ